MARSSSTRRAECSACDNGCACGAQFVRDHRSHHQQWIAALGGKAAAIVAIGVKRRLIVAGSYDQLRRRTGSPDCHCTAQPFSPRRAGWPLVISVPDRASSRPARRRRPRHRRVRRAEHICRGRRGLIPVWQKPTETGSEFVLLEMAYWRKVGETANLQSQISTKPLISLALPRGLEPLFSP
jgi:hypothetical protein